MHRQGPLQPGKVIGRRYEVVRLLRQEPFGDVALARDQLLETEVGIKVFPSDAPEFDTAFDYFRQEAIWGLKLHSPQILGMHTLEETVEGLVLVQEPFTGTTLLQLIGTGEKLTIPDALYFIEVLAKGLAYAHKQGVVHHHFSPLNVLVSATEGVKIANFAFPPDREEPSEVIRAYVPPEVLAGHDSTPAGNIYSLGVLGYRMLAGELPHLGESGGRELGQIPPAMRPLLAQCLEEVPERRFQNLTEFLVWLGRSRELLGSDAEQLALPPEPVREEPVPPPQEPPPVLTMEPPAHREPEIQIIPDWMESEELYEPPGRRTFLGDWRDRGQQAWERVKDFFRRPVWEGLRWNNKTLIALGSILGVFLLLVIYAAWPRRVSLPVETVVKDRGLEERGSRTTVLVMETAEKSASPASRGEEAGPEAPAAGSPPASTLVTAPPAPPTLGTPAAAPPATGVGRPQTPPAVVPAKPKTRKPTPPVKAKPPEKPRVAKPEQYAVLVGTYQKEADARKLADKIKAQGKATVRKSARGKKVLYQVWITPLPSKTKAEATAKAIQGSAGVTPKVIKIGGTPGR